MLMTLQRELLKPRKNTTNLNLLTWALDLKYQSKIWRNKYQPPLVFQAKLFLIIPNQMVSQEGNWMFLGPKKSLGSAQRQNLIED